MSRQVQWLGLSDLKPYPRCPALGMAAFRLGPVASDVNSVCSEKGADAAVQVLSEFDMWPEFKRNSLCNGPILTRGWDIQVLCWAIHPDSSRESSGSNAMGEAKIAPWIIEVGVVQWLPVPTGGTGVLKSNIFSCSSSGKRVQADRRADPTGLQHSDSWVAWCPKALRISKLCKKSSGLEQLVKNPSISFNALSYLFSTMFSFFGTSVMWCLTTRLGRRKQWQLAVLLLRELRQSSLERTLGDWKGHLFWHVLTLNKSNLESHVDTSKWWGDAMLCYVTSRYVTLFYFYFIF